MRFFDFLDKKRKKSQTEEYLLRNVLWQSKIDAQESLKNRVLAVVMAGSVRRAYDW